MRELAAQHGKACLQVLQLAVTCCHGLLLCWHLALWGCSHHGLQVDTYFIQHLQAHTCSTWRQHHT